MLCGNSLQALKSETRKCKDALKVTKSKSCVLEGTPPSSWDVSPRHQEKEPFAKWHSALFMLLSLLYSRHETAFLLLADEDNEQLWWSSNILMPPQIFEWFVIGGNDLGQPQNPPSGWKQSHRSSFLSISICAALSMFTEAGPAWTTTCQDVACLSASLSAHSYTQTHKHRCTCKHKHKHTLSMCLVEWPDKKNMTLSFWCARVPMHAHSHKHVSVHVWTHLMCILSKC